MAYSFHIGNYFVKRVLSETEFRAHSTFRDGNYNEAMSKQVTAIYAKRMPRLYIQEWIDHFGLDQKRLAERIGRAEGTVSKLISGEMKMTLKYLADIAHAFDIAVVDLFRHPDAPTRDELLAAGTAEELRQALRLIQLAKTGTDN